MKYNQNGKETRPQYLFNLERFKRNVGNNNVNGTSMCLEISKIKIHTKVSDEVINTLEEAHSIDPNVVYKLHDSYVIQGWCVGAPSLKMHTVIMKNKDGEWIRGTRADAPYIAYKTYKMLIGEPISRHDL